MSDLLSKEVQVGYMNGLGITIIVSQLSDVGPLAIAAVGIVIFRWEAPLFFANVGIFRQQVRSLARRADVRWIVLQCEAVTCTARSMLRSTPPRARTD